MAAASSTRWRGAATLAVAVLLWAGAGLQAAPPLCAVNPGAPIWNGTIAFNDAMAADIASSGCRAVRINFRLDGNTTWTSKLLGKYDTIIQNARNHNLQVLGLFSNETTAGTQADWNQNYNTTGLNPYLTSYAANTWLLINRYKGSIKLFELWNEPDCWAVDPNTNPLNAGNSYIWPKIHANLTAETYKKCIAMGGANFFATNGILLVSGGLFAHDIDGVFATSRPYFTNVYNQTAVWDAFQALTGRRYPWDYFGYHFYLNQGEPVSTSELLAYFDDIRAMKIAYGDASQIVVTEFGWSSAAGDDLQASNLRDTYDWLRSQSDILSAYWYQWNNSDGGYGLIYNNGSHKPSYAQFAAQCALPDVPTADFQASPPSGQFPLVVQFTDTSQGAVASRQWDFGDGTTGAQAAPSHTYRSVGTYTVSLTVTGPRDSNTKALPACISVSRRWGDMDGNGFVNAPDLQDFVACSTGPGETSIPAGCELSGLNPPANAADLDGDGDVDQADFALLQRCFNGAVPVDPDCVR